MNILDEFNKLTANEDDPANIHALKGRTEDLYLECKTINEQEIRDNLITNKQSVAYFNYGKCLSS